MTAVSEPGAETAVLGSRSPGHCWHDRIDPLHEVRWEDLSTTPWEDVAALRHRLAVDRNGYLTSIVEEERSPIAHPSGTVHGHRSVIAVAALHQFGQLTTLQLATIADSDRHRMEDALSGLWSSGVLRRMTPGWLGDGDDGGGHVWCLQRGPELERWLAPLGDLEWALLTSGSAITEGPPGSGGRPAVRHNLITAELCLRAQEVCPAVIGAWGERMCVPELLLPESEDRLRRRARTRSGDAVLITREGRLVVFEVVGSTRVNSGEGTRRLADKAAIWTAVVARSGLNMDVVFVNAGGSYHSAVERAVKWGSTEKAEELLPRKPIRERAQRRVHAVDAYRWFPFPGVIGEEFLTLTATCPAARTRGPLISDSAIPLPDRSEPVVNVLGALHTPPWVVNSVSRR